MSFYPAYLAVVILALAGCAAAPAIAPVPAPVAQPRQAILYRDTVTVQFSDGALCVAPRPGRAAQWSGTLAGCAHPLPFSVALPPGRPAPRRVLVQLGDGGTAVLTLQAARYGLAPGV